MCRLVALLLLLFSARATAEIIKGVNFIVTADDEELANRVLEEAEMMREHAALAYLGTTLPAGEGQTVIHVTLRDYGEWACFWRKSRPGRKFNHIYVKTDRERAAANPLWHEIVHLVFEIRFGGELPLWADEGFASMQDDEMRKQDRAILSQRWVHSGHWPDLKTVFDATSFSSSDVESYAAANSATRFLLTQGDAPQVLDFAMYGKQHGWDAAAQKYYGASLSQIQRAWQEWVKQPQFVSAQPES
jgi:hypothetical protein